MSVLVGTLGTSPGSGGLAQVDAAGAVMVEAGRWTLDWFVGGDDRWHLPDREPSRRQTVGAAPVVTTALRLPGGDAIARVYGAVPTGGRPGASLPAGLVVVEVENASPAPCVVGFRIRAADDGFVRRLTVARRRVEVDDAGSLYLPFAPPRWSVAPETPTGTAPDAPDSVDARSIAVSGAAHTGEVPVVTDGSGHAQLAVLYPLAHRARMRVAITPDGSDADVDLAALAGPDDVARGWEAAFPGAMRVVLPDEQVANALELALSQVLLDPRPSGDHVAALEAWGRDADAAERWEVLSGRERRAARRPFSEGAEIPAEVRETAGEDATHHPAAWLRDVRAALLSELRRPRSAGGVHRPRSEAGVDLAPGWPSRWAGAPLEVYDAPTRFGLVSYALRWHGARPALLWEVRDAAPGLVLRASRLAPAWTTEQWSGEVLLPAVVGLSPVDPA